MRTFMYAQLWHEHSSSCAYFNPLAFGPWFPNCPKSRGILQKAKMFWSKKNKECFEVISEVLITTALINTILFMLSQSSPHNNLYLLLFSVLYMFVLYLFVLCLCFGIGPVSTLVLSLVDYPTVFHLFCVSPVLASLVIYPLLLAKSGFVNHITSFRTHLWFWLLPPDSDRSKYCIALVTLHQFMSSRFLCPLLVCFHPDVDAAAWFEGKNIKVSRLLLCNLTK